MSRDDDVAAINAMVAAAGPRIDALLTDRNDALAKAKSEPTIRNALIALLALAERWAVKIDWEWGDVPGY